MEIPGGFLKPQEWDDQAKLILSGYKKRIKGERAKDGNLVTHEYFAARIKEMFLPEYENLLDAWKRGTLFKAQGFHVIETWLGVPAVTYYNDIRFLNAIVGTAGCCGFEFEPLVLQAAAFGEKWLKPDLDFRRQFFKGGRVDIEMSGKMETKLNILRTEFDQMVRERI
jgi:hypothetical protein